MHNRHKFHSLIFRDQSISSSLRHNNSFWTKKFRCALSVATDSRSAWVILSSNPQQSIDLIHWSQDHSRTRWQGHFATLECRLICGLLTQIELRDLGVWKLSNPMFRNIINHGISCGKLEKDAIQIRLAVSPPRPSSESSKCLGYQQNDNEWGKQEKKVRKKMFRKE